MENMLNIVKKNQDTELCILYNSNNTLQKKDSSFSEMNEKMKIAILMTMLV
jgi:hypothetical protein